MAGLRLLYVAPERFASPGFLERIRHADIGLFVVDEAHCVSQWGHDFRPDYFRLADAARWLGAKAITASTATATPQVAADIVQRLGLRDPVQGGDRVRPPNLSFAVVPCLTKEAVHRGIAESLGEPGAARDRLRGHARSATGWRSGSAPAGRRGDRLPRGLAREERAEAQRRFMSGEVPLVVATNAFGMGVDKADVRTVCQSVPASVEAYYQEAGRAGRDGRAGRCLLFATGRDKGLHVFFIERSQVSDDELKAVARAIVRSAEPPPADAAPERCRPGVPAGFLSSLPRPARRRKVRAIVGHLARMGIVQPSPSAPDRVAGRISGEWDARAFARCRTARRRDEGALAPVPLRVGLESRATLPPRGILRHFGDGSAPAPAGPCCDVCDPSLRPEIPQAARAGARRQARASSHIGRCGRRRGPRRGDPGNRRGGAARVGARARSRCCAAGARRSCRSTPTTGCRTTAPTGTCAPESVLGAWTR